MLTCLKYEQTMETSPEHIFHMCCHGDRAVKNHFEKRLPSFAQEILWALQAKQERHPEILIDATLPPQLWCVEEFCCQRKPLGVTQRVIY